MAIANSESSKVGILDNVNTNLCVYTRHFHLQEETFLRDLSFQALRAFRHV